MFVELAQEALRSGGRLDGHRRQGRPWIDPSKLGIVGRLDPTFCRVPVASITSRNLLKPLHLIGPLGSASTADCKFNRCCGSPTSLDPKFCPARLIGPRLQILCRFIKCALDMGANQIFRRLWIAL
jgi:hypothetical protein